MTTKFCKKCQEDVLTEQDTQGVIWCKFCGMKLDSNILVTELDFQNQKAVGKFVHDGLLRGK